MPLCTFQRVNKKLENNEVVKRQKRCGRPPNLKGTERRILSFIAPKSKSVSVAKESGEMVSSGVRTTAFCVS